MARQKTKISDRFGSGGDKDGSPEERFLTGDTDIQIDAEWKAMDLLRTQIDELTDVINANDAGSGSFASEIKNLTSASGSFSTRVTLNDAKSTAAVSNGTGGSVKLTLNDTGLVFTIGRSTYTVRKDG